MEHKHFVGLIAAPLSVLNSDKSVNLKGIKNYANLLAKNGVVGAFVNGTTGEGLSLTVKERMDIAAEWVKAAPESLKIIVHIGHASLQDSKILANHAQEIGAYAIASIGSIYFKPNNLHDLVEYSAQQAASAPKLPYFYYHIPSLTGINYPMREYLKLAKDRIPNLAGIKYTFETLMDYELCRLYENERFDMMMGRDEMLLCGLVLGAKSAVGSTYNFAAPLYNEMIAEYNKGNIPKAQILQRKSMELVEILLMHNKFFAAAKACMKRLGIDCGPVRPPLPDLTITEIKALNQKLDEFNFNNYACK